MLRASTLVLLVGLVSCMADADRGPQVVETDSAGVTIVTNLDLEVGDWQVDSEPTLELGTFDEGGPEQFFRVSAARRLRSREIAVLDGSREIRVFASDGSFVRLFGGEGDGPGEYRGPSRMFLLGGDSLAIWDVRLLRLTILDDRGNVGRIISPDGVGRRPQILTVLPDGSTLFEQEVLLGYNPREYTQKFSNYLLYGPDGELVDSLPQQPRVEIALWGEGPLAGPRLFDEGTQFAGDWSGYWIGTTKVAELSRYSLSGELERIVRWPAEDRSLEPEAVDLSLREALESMGSRADQERFTEMHRSRGVPDQYPSHGPLLVDNLSFLWVQDFERPGHGGAVRWRVFDAAGALSANVHLPRGHRVFDVGEDYILAMGRDDYDVEYIRMFRLSRSVAP